MKLDKNTVEKVLVAEDILIHVMHELEEKHGYGTAIKKLDSAISKIEQLLYD